MKNILSLLPQGWLARLKKHKHLPVIIGLVLLAVVTHPSWYLSLKILTHGDWWFDYQEKMSAFFSRPFIWTSFDSLGGVNLGASFWPFLFASGLLAKLGANYNLIERVIFFWPAGILLLVSSYFLAYQLTRSRLAGIVGAIVYSFNAPMVVGQTGILTLVMANALAPLAIYFFRRALEEKKLSWAIMSGWLSFSVAFYEFRLFYLLFILLVFFGLYYFLIEEKQKDWRSLIQIGIYLGAVFLIGMGLSFYWLRGINQTRALVTNDLLHRGIFGNQFVNIAQSLNFFPYLWNGSKPEAFIVQEIPAYFYLIPLFAFSSLIIVSKKDRKKALFFAFLSLLAIVLIKQGGRPWPSLYRWLFDYFPGFGVFREGSKFYFFLGIGYSILIAFFVKAIWGKPFFKKKHFLKARSWLTLMVASLFLINTWPMITGQAQTLFVGRTIPDDYLFLRDFISTQDDYFRTLWIPRSSRWGVYNNLHPRLNLSDLFLGVWRPLVDHGPEDDFTWEKMFEFLSLPQADLILDQASVKYLIVPLRDVENDDDFFVYYGGDRQAYINFLDQLDWLEKVEVDLGQLAVYENKDYHSKFYLPQKTYWFGGDPVWSSWLWEAGLIEDNSTALFFEPTPEQAGLHSEVIVSPTTGKNFLTDLVGLPETGILPDSPLAFLVKDPGGRLEKLGLEDLFAGAGERLAQIGGLFSNWQLGTEEYVLVSQDHLNHRYEELMTESFAGYVDYYQQIDKTYRSSANPGDGSCSLIETHFKQQLSFLTWFRWETSRRGLFPKIVNQINDFLFVLDSTAWYQDCQEKIEADAYLSQLGFYQLPKTDRYEVWINDDGWRELTRLELEAGKQAKERILEKIFISTGLEFDLEIEIFLRLVNKHEVDLVQLEWQEKSPVEHTVSLPFFNQGRWLIFNEGFAFGWQAAGFSDQALVNLYASGWFFDSQPATEVGINYQPQKGLREGGFVSLGLAVFSGVVYWWAKRKESRDG